MKSFIYKVNQYLIERYPTVWNTKLVWMLASAIILHLLFFVMGFFTISNPASLQERGINDIFFENGAVFMSVIITILMLVIWLVYLFKNNAFKNFYPTSRAGLFLAFLYHILIIFVSSSFYLSYNYGMKAQIALSYSDARIADEIALANEAAVFFSEKVSDYTLDKREYPEPFDQLFCETRDKLIDYNQPYTSFLDNNYQFFSIYKKEASKTPRYSEPQFTGYIYKKSLDSMDVYYFKDKLIDVSNLINNSLPSYYNYSSTLYISKNDSLNQEDLDYDYDNYSDFGYDHSPQASIRGKLQNKRSHELLRRNNPSEIKQLLSQFLSMSSAYKIKHNLAVDQWFELVYHPTNFEVKSFIRDQKKPDYYYEDDRALLAEKDVNRFLKERLTDYYFESKRLRNVFENIETIKASNPFMDGIHVFMWLAFFLSALIFMFRITGLKSLLFAIVTVGVLILVIALLAILLAYASSGNDNLIGYFISYFAVLLGATIFAIPLFFARSVKKSVVAICLNISIAGFVPYLLLILALIAMHQKDLCEARSFKNDYYNCPTIFDYLEFNWSFVLFFTGLALMYFYTTIIKRWKSLPES
ncbi:hypothetical protein ESY86_03190 [Subsaximicrobium wynnwilliamsii]|uniref:Uncharacterized protein n=1 Tax=Subsaximicrobium wynnwilliamsii TaxID=291179 RepID=A0A5C6ZK71_9FLAO|nr:hypothetical protein [Subsaximicrobium wynnwilliamsii]TXD84716.1 hypothetical protein ESY87_02970 [Subsaximicrobium wynnwilliamsii]TXD90386.1 hypothetical protein ESY86_03190 [Subsaximicrobium wynnwilliamsii]TXE04862.1 hypothetical protein ESY88_01500 [Subsaximicrobium wynnwilliamsii]